MRARGPSVPSGRTRTAVAPKRSWPSRKTVARIGITSPGTALAGQRPSSTTGKTSVTGIRPIGAYGAGCGAAGVGGWGTGAEARRRAWCSRSQAKPTGSRPLRHFQTRLSFRRDQLYSILRSARIGIGRVGASASRASECVEDVEDAVVAPPLRPARVPRGRMIEEAQCAVEADRIVISARPQDGARVAATDLRDERSRGTGPLVRGGRGDVLDGRRGRGRGSWGPASGSRTAWPPGGA